MKDERLDEALAALRDEVALGAPDRALEARLLARHRWRRPRRLFPTLAVGAVLAGSAFAAGGGVAWVRSLWFGVEVDGEQYGERLRPNESRTLLVPTDSGGEARIEIGSETLEGGGLRTRIAIDQVEGEGLQLERESEEHIAVEGRASAAREWVALDRIGERAPLLEGLDPAGRPFRLWFDSAAEPPRLLLHRPHLDARRAAVVRELETFPAGVRTEAQAELDEEGALLVRVDSAGGFETEIVVPLTDAAPPASSGPTVLETPDGRIRVELVPERAQE